MYINQIESFLDTILDNYYLIMQEEMFTTKFSEQYEKINMILETFITKINFDKLLGIINKSDLPFIKEIINKYIAFYTYLFIGYDYNDTDKHFINNIIELSKNTSVYKIKSFYNSNSISQLIYGYEFIKKIKNLLNMSKTDIATNINKYKNEVAFLNELGNDYVSEYFMNNNKKQNIIKTYILKNLYDKLDRTYIYDIIKTNEEENNEYTYINIAVQDYYELDKKYLENIVPKKYKKIINNFYEYIIKKKLDDKNDNSNIDILFNNKIIIPIINDILLYHKETEKYETYVNIEYDNKKKEDTRLKYITNKIELATELYSNDEKKRQQSEKIFYLPLIHRNAILINCYEDNKIEKKLQDLGKRAIDNSELLEDFLNYKTYAYVNFKDMDKNSYLYHVKKTINVIRYPTFKFIDKNSLQYRTSSEDQFIEIVGIIYPPMNRNLKCVKPKSIKQLNYKSISNYISESLLKPNVPVYWIFNINDIDKSNNNSNQDIIKHYLDKLYDNICEIIKQRILELFIKFGKMPIQRMRKIIDVIEKYTFQIDRSSKIYNDIEYVMYKNNLETIDKNIDLANDFSFGKVMNYTQKPNLPICQHYFDQHILENAKKNNVEEYSNMLDIFTNKYIIENNDNNMTCKSCSSQIILSNFVNDGKFDNSTNTFVSQGSYMGILLEDMKDYSQLSDSIKIIDKLINKIASIINISHLVGDINPFKSNRSNVTKNIIDYSIKSLELTKSSIKGENLNKLLCYIIIELIMEINNGNLITLFSDKLCNHLLFEKYWLILFDNIKIVYTNNNDMTNITNYKMLCYLIYIMACCVVKYEIWNINDKNNKNNKNFVINTKIIMQSVTELINTLTKNKNFLNKLIIKLEVFFCQKRIYFGKNINDKQNINKQSPIKYKEPKYLNIYKPKTRKQSPVNKYNTSLIYCSGGGNIVHSWGNVNKKTICSKCNVNIDDIDENKIIKIKGKDHTIKKIEYNYNEKGNEKFINKIKNIDSNIYQNLVDNIIEIVGESVSIDDNKYDINNDIYIIDHDRMGNKLQNKLIISEKSNQISFDNKTTICYTDKDKNKALYDYKTRVLMGYKLNNNENIINNIVTSKRIEVYRSIKYKLLNIKNIKIAIQYTMIILRRIKEKYPIQETEDNNFCYEIINKYIDKINDIIIDKVFNKYFTRIQNINDDNLLLNYYISNLLDVINLNKLNNSLSNIIHLIIELINYIYDVTNPQDEFENVKFKYIMNAGENVGNIYETEQLTDIYEEFIDPDDKITDEEKDEKENIKEELDAVDVINEADLEFADDSVINDITEMAEWIGNERELNYFDSYI